MLVKTGLYKWLHKNGSIFHPVVRFDPAKDKILPIDSSENNKDLLSIDFEDTEALSDYIDRLLQAADAKFGIGGYDEIRPMYSRSSLFNHDIAKNSAVQEEPRRLHIGVDISGKEGTAVFAPCDSIVHSFANNNNFGDYGPTIILFHVFGEISFYTLYGHLKPTDLERLHEGDIVKRGQKFAHFGSQDENGHWPPHLHFQVIEDIGNFKGDYPGVCKISEREQYLENCPDPELILNILKFIGNS